MIRIATKNDAPTIIEFNKRLAFETERLILDDIKITTGVTTIINDSSKGVYYVYEFEGKVIAQLLITFEYSDWRNANIWWIQSVYVDSNFRRQGYFQLLYQHVKNIVDSNPQIAGLRLYVEKANTTAQKTYTRLGMNESYYNLYEWLK
jgi:GNAT superfamily N-acetyltransferase